MANVIIKPVSKLGDRLWITFLCLLFATISLQTHCTIQHTQKIADSPYQHTVVHQAQKWLSWRRPGVENKCEAGM